MRSGTNTPVRAAKQQGLFLQVRAKKTNEQACGIVPRRGQLPTKFRAGTVSKNHNRTSRRRFPPKELFPAKEKILINVDSNVQVKERGALRLAKASKAVKQDKKNFR